MRLHINFSVMAPLFAPLALDLQARYGVEACSGFVYGRDGLREVKDFGFDTSNMRVLSQFLETFDDSVPPDMAYLRQKEREYGEPNLYAMISGCRFVSQFEHQRALRVLEGGFRLFEDLFDRFKPDAVLSHGVGCTMSYIQYAIARRRNLPFLGLSSSRITNRFYIIHSHLERYDRMERLFAEYKQHGLPPELKAKAQAFLDQFRGRAERPAYFAQGSQPPRLNARAWRELIALFYRYYGIERGNYIMMSPLQAITGRLNRMAKTFVLDRRHFEMPVAGDKFVFFPLHYQPEASTLIWAPYYVDQITLAENVAKTLPIDQVLYVKEHKAMLGRRPIGYYSRLKKIPNVRLISPHADSHDLIKQASATCVVSSTVGWEAILYEKPVISLGDAFYNAFDLVRQVRALADLPEAFRDVIANFTPDRELLLAFIAALLEGTYEGNADYLPGISSRTIEAARIRRLSDVVASELGLADASAV